MSAAVLTGKLHRRDQQGLGISLIVIN